MQFGQDWSTVRRDPKGLKILTWGSIYTWSTYYALYAGLLISGLKLDLPTGHRFYTSKVRGPNCWWPLLDSEWSEKRIGFKIMFILDSEWSGETNVFAIKFIFVSFPWVLFRVDIFGYY